MEYRHSFERTFDVGADAMLRIANRRGELVIRGTDRSDISFTAELRVDADDQQEADDRFAAVDLPMRQSGDTVEVGPPDFAEQDTIRIFGFSIPAAWRDPRLDMVVEVPHHCRIEADLRRGRTRIEGISAAVQVNCRTGQLRIADIDGALDVEGRTGAVEVRSVTGSVRVRTRTGKIEVADIEGDTELSTRTGTISARRVTGLLHGRTRTGAIRASECSGRFDLHTTTGVVEYRGEITADGTIDVKTGRITLGVRRGASFYLDALSHRGDVSSELDVSDMEPPQEDAPTVQLRTHTGSIRIVPD